MLDAAACAQLGAAGAWSGLGGRGEEIDALNVFPVPDGDTGTNLYLTMESAVEAMDGAPDRRWTARDALGRRGPRGGSADLAAPQAMAHGALMGARGNSGVILSQILRGMSEARVPASGVADGDELGGRDAASRAAPGPRTSAYAAVASRVEGTILTVMRAAADAAAGGVQHGAADAVPSVRGGGASGAREALARTPDQLEALRRAGVVDAGGRGLVVVLDALVGVVTGAAARGDAAGRTPRLPPPVDADVAHDYGGPALRGHVPAATPTTTPSRAARDARRARGLASWSWAGTGCGTSTSTSTTPARPSRRASRPAGPTGSASPTCADRSRRAGRRRMRHERAVVAVSHGPGVRATCSGVPGPWRRAGAGPAAAAHRARCSTASRLAHAAEVIVLPSDKDIRAVAEAAAEQARADGVRVPSSHAGHRADPRGLAVHDPRCRFDDDVVAMTPPPARRATARSPSPVVQR